MKILYNWFVKVQNKLLRKKEIIRVIHLIMYMKDCIVNKKMRGVIIT